MKANQEGAGNPVHGPARRPPPPGGGRGREHGPGKSGGGGLNRKPVQKIARDNVRIGSSAGGLFVEEVLRRDGAWGDALQWRVWQVGGAVGGDWQNGWERVLSVTNSRGGGGESSQEGGIAPPPNASLVWRWGVWWSPGSEHGAFVRRESSTQTNWKSSSSSDSSKSESPLLINVFSVNWSRQQKRGASVSSNIAFVTVDSISKSFFVRQ